MRGEKRAGSGGAWSAVGILSWLLKLAGRFDSKSC